MTGFTKDVAVAVLSLAMITVILSALHFLATEERPLSRRVLASLGEVPGAIWARETDEDRLDRESGAESDGERVSLRSIEVEGHKLRIIHRIRQTTDPPRGGVLLRSVLPVTILFWDRQDNTLASVQKHIILNDAYVCGDPCDTPLEVSPPPGAHSVSVQSLGGLSTKRVPIAITK